MSRLRSPGLDLTQRGLDLNQQAVPKFVAATGAINYSKVMDLCKPPLAGESVRMSRRGIRSTHQPAGAGRLGFVLAVSVPARQIFNGDSVC
ncbi:unnamed protein product [marine sediment metagenome]|uniref:Uncharacterized protein n=1 Tax=marine sediment metagenome TaxID=412755 RepID=X0X6M4_9ZZZZ